MILGENVRLRAPERDDLPRFVAWLNDPEVREGLTVSLPLSLAEEERWFDSMLEKPAEEHPMVIEIRTGEKWVAVGNCGFHAVDHRSRSAEAGIFIGEKSYWSRGFGTQVMRLLQKHGFETLNLNRIALRVYEDNPRALHAYLKAGFIEEGRLRQGLYKNGRYIDVILMSILRSDWEN